MAQAQPYKLNVSMGGDTFNGEGREEVVREDYDKWLAAKSAVRATVPPAAPSPPRLGGTGEEPPAAAQGIPGGLERATVERVLGTDREGRVTLRQRLTTDTPFGDAILLLLYGYRALLGQEWVLATRLNAAIHDTFGAQGDFRVDRALGKDLSLVRYTGKKGGKKYALYAAGVAKAESVIARIAAM
jgi:hypothetical protein